ncbi:hypothetical protein [Haploplasma axanthum]|nr:hypothetical protein [Haploplasma axanthum]
MRKIIIMFLTFFSLFALTACKKRIEINGEKNFYYHRYVEKTATAIDDIYIPIIVQKEIKEIDLIEINFSTNSEAKLELEGFKLIDEYKKYYLYQVKSKLSEVSNSIVIENMKFKVNNEEIINYKPVRFAVVKARYEEIDHDIFKLFSKYLVYNEVENPITYMIEKIDEVDIKDIITTEKIISTTYGEQNTISGYLPTITVHTEDVGIAYPAASVIYNMEFVLEYNGEEYSYTKNIMSYVGNFRGLLEQILNEESK